ncbi:TRA2A protein, partial [Polyodon spathula]|nr:TRA2A protein [Polyodon spathula]
MVGRSHPTLPSNQRFRHLSITESSRNLKGAERSRSRKHSHRRYSRSRSRSHSHRKKSRSRSYSPECRRKKSRSTSPMSNRRRHAGSRANPDPNTCLGVFGLSLYTTERDLREVFSRYGPLAGVNVVYDQRTGRSRGFSFVYFERIDDAKEEKCQRIRFGRSSYYFGGRRRDSYYDRGGYDRGGYDRGGYDRYDEYDNRYSRQKPLNSGASRTESQCSTGYNKHGENMYHAYRVHRVPCSTRDQLILPPQRISTHNGCDASSGDQPQCGLPSA